MAFIQMNVMSKCLMRTVQVNVILPVDKLGADQVEDKKFKTLYLLHGILGSQVDWVNNTRIQRYAEEKNLAVVMPAGDNSFYLDEPKGQRNYGEFIGREIVELTRKMFPLSDKREDTFIGGLSMGGYGAMRNGLKYSDTFSSIIALSGAVTVDNHNSRKYNEENWLDGREFYEACFGDLTTVMESDKNPKWIVDKLIEDGKDIPDIYMACGLQDILLPLNNDLDEFFTDRKVKHIYNVEDGNHEWGFWDRHIEKAIYEWLPLEEACEGIHSGNIGK